MRLKKGDPDAWDLFIERYSYDLRQQIIKMMNKRGVLQTELKDIHQLTWQVGYQKITSSDFVPPDNPEAAYHYLVVIAKHLILQRRRGLNREMKHTRPLEDWLEEGAESDASGEMDENLPPESIILRYQHEAEMQRLLALIETAMQDLNIRPHHREIYRYYCELGMLDNIPSHHLLPMAKKHNMTPSGVRKVVERTNVSVRGWMKRNGYTFGGDK
jgi:DNA-directed RNA polymerase specialized sigma24 family protein